LLYSSQLPQLSWLRHGFGTKSDQSMAETVFVKQIHSAIVLEAQNKNTGCLGEGDAVVSNQSGLTLEIRTADCYPVLLSDAKNRAVAAIHAGWRGTSARIVPATLAKMGTLYGTKSADVYVAIGPGIGSCCYEVGQEVANQFNATCVHRRGGELFLDLAQANRQQAVSTGVPESQIDVSGLCTFCEAGKFYSYRREKEKAGRMRSWIGVVA
jgi:YfiH family protein